MIPNCQYALKIVQMKRNKCQNKAESRQTKAVARVTVDSAIAMTALGLEATAHPLAQGFSPERS